MFGNKRPTTKRMDIVATKEIQSYTVHFMPAEEGGFTVLVPALEGVVTEGDTFEEAEKNAREAIALHLEALEAKGLPIPDDRETVIKRVTILTPAHSQ